MDHLHGVENIVDDAAKLPVVLVAHRFQIDLVAVSPRTYKIQHLRCRVSVGDECGAKSGRLRFLENLDGPLGGNQRFVVAGAHERRSVGLGHGH